MGLYEDMQAFAKKENIIAGAGDAGSFTELKAKLEGRSVPFVDYSVEMRTEPLLTMPDAKSIVCIGLSYNTVYKPINDGRARGKISSGAVGTDYHILVREKLEKLRAELIPSHNAMIFTDTGPLSDRAVAERCALGGRGRNGSIINKDIGGMFFIGYMLTDADFTAGHKNKECSDMCGECDKCVKACPNSALDNGECDYKKCISYITQKKGALTYEEYSAIGSSVYGCDVCQRVCPYNGGYAEAESEYAYPDIERLLDMSEKEFGATYGRTAAGWRGKSILKRNALAVLGNMGDERGIELASRFLKGPSEQLRSAAEYAVSKIREK